MQTMTKLNAISFVIAALSGCGGGGGSSSAAPTPTPPVAKAQGLFEGVTASGTSLEEIVLEDGSFWGIYGTQSGSGLLVSGFETGQVTSSNNGFSLTFTDFPNPGNTSVSGTGSGSYTASAFNGSVTENGVTQSFSLSSPATSAYVYNTPALVSSVTGTWSGNLTDGESGSVTILSDGTFTGTTSGGCGFSGKFTPRPSGVNVFNVTLNFGVSLCSYPGQVATGIAIVSSLSNGTSELIVTGTLPSLAAGTSFFAVR